MYNKYQNEEEYNECSGRGMCSIAPNVASFQEIMLILLRNVTYYVINLEKIGHDCSDIKLSIVKHISSLVTTPVYSDEQLLSAIICAYNDLIRLRRQYSELCNEKNILCKDLKLPLKLVPSMVLSDVLSIGQRSLVNKLKRYSDKQKIYSELLAVAIKSVVLSIAKLMDYNIQNSKAIETVLKAINIFNFKNFPLTTAHKMVSELSLVDVSLWHERKDAQESTYGEMKLTNVSQSTKQGKAILVSGSSLNDLYNLLQATNGENIDIYTHGDLIIAHAYEKFKMFKNLKGHYGSNTVDCILDFATFPGAILLTKNSNHNIEYLIRGRLFTTDEIVPKGVVRVDKNFTSIINAAKKARGFSKGQIREEIVIGFDFKEVESKLNIINEKFISGEIRHLFIVGMSNFTSEQSKYFDSLFKAIPKNCQIISFAYHCDCENVLYLNIANNFPLQLKILDTLFRKVPIVSDRVTFFVTKCDANTLSSMVNLFENGAKSVYLSTCPPTVINPTILKSFMELYSINHITNPTDDLRIILNIR